MQRLSHRPSELQRLRSPMQTAACCLVSSREPWSASDITQGWWGSVRVSFIPLVDRGDNTDQFYHTGQKHVEKPEKQKVFLLSGQVNQGEMVGLVRQPQNPYDRNAVMVANIYGNQVGHIKKELAAAMAYIMDNNIAKVEGWAAMCPWLFSLSENRTIITWTPKQKYSGVADH